MATRSSDYYNRVNYKGTWRGRSREGDIGFEQFPQKYESTPIIEFPNAVYNDRRDALRDRSPDPPLFPEEEPRRNTYAKDHLNLREGARTLTFPWKNDDYDTQFHDHDPRGWSPEQNWEEYRRNLTAHLRELDFADDGDYSTTGGGVHPNTLYKNIRDTQNWLKARLKIFSTSYEGRSNGGVGVYPNVSEVFKSDYEDTSVAERSALSDTIEDPIIRARMTSRLSNIVHEGSAFLRANTTTDHRVPVAAYGKLYSDRGLIPHETQMRIVEDDTNWSRLEGLLGAPRNLVRLMAARVGREKMQDGDKARYPGRAEDAATNRSSLLTRDIMSLLGVTEAEVKFLESREQQNDKQAHQALADLYHMSELVHALPAHAKLEIRDELLARSAGQGLVPATGSERRKLMDQVVVNPRLVEFMSLLVRKEPAPGDPAANRDEAEADLARLQQQISETPMFVYRSGTKNSEDLDAINNMRESLTSAPVADRTTETHSYAALAKRAENVQRNRENTLGTRVISTPLGNIHYHSAPHEGDYHDQQERVEVDNDFGDNRFLTRHIGRMGSKYMNRHVVHDRLNSDDMNELGSVEPTRTRAHNKFSKKQSTARSRLRQTH